MMSLDTRQYGRRRHEVCHRIGRHSFRHPQVLASDPGGYARIAAWTRSQTADEALSELARADVPAARVHDAESRAADGRFHERQLFHSVPAGHNRGLRVQGVPFVMSRATPGIRRQAPAIGQDTDKTTQWLKSK